MMLKVQFARVHEAILWVKQGSLWSYPSIVEIDPAEENAKKMRTRTRPRYNPFLKRVITPKPCYNGTPLAFGLLRIPDLTVMITGVEQGYAHSR